MVWADFVAAVKSEDFTGGVRPEASRYGGVADMYASSNMAASSPAMSTITEDLCFITVGVADLAFAALFVTEPNILVLDWDLSVSRAMEIRLQEMQQIFIDANYNPSQITNSDKLQENVSTEPYDYEYWERMCMALIGYYRNNTDPRAQLLQQELNNVYIEHKQAYKRLLYLSHGEKYEDNEINRESMEEFSIGNQQRMLGETFYDDMRNLFFKFVDEAILRNISNKNYCYIDINFLDVKIITNFISLMQKFNLKINRFNLADILDELVLDPDRLTNLITALQALQKITSQDAKMLISHVSDFSLCITWTDALQVFAVLLVQSKEANDNPRIGDIPIEELFDKNYLQNFVPYSVVTTDKSSFL